MLQLTMMGNEIPEERNKQQTKKKAAKQGYKNKCETTNKKCSVIYD